MPKKTEEPRLLLLVGEEVQFLEQAIEVWKAVYAGDPDFERYRSDRANVLRKMAHKYTSAEREQIGEVALGLMD